MKNVIKFETKGPRKDVQVRPRCVSRKKTLLAYTCNNTQPVICTIVADQPYFYIQDDEGNWV